MNEKNGKNGTDLPSDGSTQIELDDYQKNIKLLSDAIVSAQSPIRILDAIKWNSKIKENFFAKKFEKLRKNNRSNSYRISHGENTYQIRLLQL